MVRDWVFRSSMSSRNRRSHMMPSANWMTHVPYRFSPRAAMKKMSPWESRSGSTSSRVSWILGSGLTASTPQFSPVRSMQNRMPVESMACSSRCGAKTSTSRCSGRPSWTWCSGSCVVPRNSPVPRSWTMKKRVCLGSSAGRGTSKTQDWGAWLSARNGAVVHFMLVPVYCTSHLKSLRPGTQSPFWSISAPLMVRANRAGPSTETGAGPSVPKWIAVSASCMSHPLSPSAAGRASSGSHTVCSALRGSEGSSFFPQATRPGPSHSASRTSTFSAGSSVGRIQNRWGFAGSFGGVGGVGSVMSIGFAGSMPSSVETGSAASPWG
mmetsp:Transcript_49611/g.88623  ORF Transcript_49611/g.88623 Transcript_49611/m.88623 type:complete len:324 (+) Transcript_49611:478-1449(+)